LALQTEIVNKELAELLEKEDSGKGAGEGDGKGKGKGGY
jgi:hypothetical protein